MGLLGVCLWMCAGITAAVWLASLVTRDYSWTDRIWSLAPIGYVWVFAAWGGGNARLTLVAVLVTAWGARLTFNFARKGGYRPGGEDYRWAFLRSIMPGWVYQLFNLAFIAVYQNALILAMTLPVVTMREDPRPLGVWDVVLATAFLAALVGETVADQQQWNFHRWKAAERAAGRRPEPGFLTAGMFAHSRHPNYLFEQLQWWIVYGFAIVASGSVLHWTIAGAVLLTLLFAGSAWFTEYLSASKYPQYREYQRLVPRMIPLPRRRAAAPQPVGDGSAAA